MDKNTDSERYDDIFLKSCELKDRSGFKSGLIKSKVDSVHIGSLIETKP